MPRGWRAAPWLVMLVLLLYDCPAGADDFARIYRSIETPHFRITYYVFKDGRGLEKVAQRVAVIAEESRRRLVPYLGKGLGSRRRTEVLITDETDDFNGSATVLPYPAMRLFATSPDDRAELNDYDDWLTGLFLHEYTHILHIGTIGGVCATVLNALVGWGVGTIYAPNQLQPRFLIEGLAVHEESERSSGGRLRNAVWDMYLRAQTLEGRFQRIDQFANDPIQFPFSNSPYLYGSAMMRYVAQHYGEDVLLKYSLDYGSNCIPLAINRSLRRATSPNWDLWNIPYKRQTGKTWNQIYDEFKADSERHYGAQRDAIARRGITPSLRLTSFAESVSRPAFTPDGQHILFAESDNYSRPRIKRVPVGGGKIVTELNVDGAGGPSLSSDGRVMVYSAVDVWRTFYLHNDLYKYDRRTKETRRLTWGLRAQNPGVSYDGKRAVFEVNDASSRGLGLIDLDSGKIDMLIPTGGFEQVYTPVFSPDGKTVAFSWWRESGFRDIWTMDLETRALTRLTEDRSVDMEPKYSPDGKWLYFVSDRTGVHNLYAHEVATGNQFQVTNVVNGAFDPAISPDGKKVAYVGFVADGYVLEVADLDPERWWPAAPPLLDRPSWPPPRDEKPLRSKSYNPARTAFPWIFTPFTQTGGYGQIIGLRVSGQDLVPHHVWSAQIGFGTGRSDDVAASINYSYLRLWPSINIGVGRSLQRRNGLILDSVERGYDEDSWTFAAGVGLPLLRRLYESVTLNFSYNLNYTRNMTPVPVPAPFERIPVLPEVGRVAGFGLSFNYNSTRRFQYSISAEGGRDLSLSVGIGSRYLGSSFEVQTFSWRWFEYISMPWKPKVMRNQVLVLGYSGGLSGGDLKHRGLFYLGGYPQQNLLTSLYDFSRPGSASLRGYPYASVAGDQFHVLNIEYRFPIAWIQRGLYKTFPLFFKRLHGRVFLDYGGAFFDGFSFDKLKLGVGAEVMCELTYLYYFPAALQLGYAYGVDKGGGNQVYFLLNSPF